MMKYVFKADEVLAFRNSKDADPQVIGEALDHVRVNAGGALHAGDVFDAARDPKNPLHAHFEWDREAAFVAHNMDIARALIRVIRVVDVEAAEGNVRAFINVRAADTGQHSYRTVADVRSSPDMSAVVLAAAERDLEAFLRRYRELKEILYGAQLTLKAIRKERSGRDEGRLNA